MKTLDPASPAARDLASGRYVIRAQTSADMAAVTVPWMAELGWNPGHNDAQTYLAADPGGFLVGELDGVPIATVSAVRYSDEFAFFGCYIVREGYRGAGYGLAIHEAGRRRVEGCVQGGDAVIENIPVYERIGRVRAYGNARHEGLVPPLGEADPDDDRTVDAAAVPFERIEAVDRPCFPAPRSAFLRAWIAQPGAVARALPRPDGSLAGYGVARPCVRGWHVGPLFADDGHAADAILDAILARLPEGDPWVLDVPEPNTAARAIVERHAMTEVFATARMYTGPAPVIDLGRVFGVTTFELG